MLIDTGSPVTLLRGDVWDKCNKKHQELELWMGQQLVGVNGTPLAIRGFAVVEILLSQVTFKHQMLIVDSLVSESILGLDFLQKNRCTIDLVQGLLFGSCRDLT